MKRCLLVLCFFLLLFVCAVSSVRADCETDVYCLDQNGNTLGVVQWRYPYSGYDWKGSGQCPSNCNNVTDFNFCFMCAEKYFLQVKGFKASCYQGGQKQACNLQPVGQ